MVRGKKEFSEFITKINAHKINLTEDAKNCLGELIDVWRETNDDNDFIYLENKVEYDEIIYFIKKESKQDLLGRIWYEHVNKITTHKITSDDPKYMKLNLSAIEFKLKYFEDWNNLCDEEIKMLDFFREVESISILMKNSTYSNKTFIDKLTVNTKELPYKNIGHGMITIKKSNIHGYGVFAVDDIPENTIITFYPIDGYCENDNYYISKEMDEIDDAPNYEDHSFVVDDEITILGDPKKHDNNLLLGHMINDSVGNIFEKYDKNDEYHSIKNGVYEYVTKSNNNCIIKVNKKYGIVYVLTTEYVYQGEELLTSYTPYYWFSRVSNNFKLFYEVCSEGKTIELLKNNVFCR